MMTSPERSEARMQAQPRAEEVLGAASMPAIVSAIVLLALLEVSNIATFFLGGEFTRAIQEVRASEGGRIGDLALLAMSARSGQQWERARKEERLEALTRAPH